MLNDGQKTVAAEHYDVTMKLDFDKGPTYDLY